MTTRLLHVNGVALNAELRAPNSPQRGTLVLVHGFTGSAAGWDAHLDAFADCGFRAVALDMLGHGRSDAPADAARYAIERASDDILATLAVLGIASQDTILLGYSMGGRLALHTALTAPFRAIVLESTSPGLADARERELRRGADECLAATIERDGVPAFVDVWERLPLWESQRSLPAERRAVLRAQRLRNSAAGLANSLRGAGTGTQPPLWGRLPELRVPVLLLAGALDGKFCRIAEQMAARLPDARLRIIPDAGHAIHFERPDDFDAAILDYVMGLPKRAHLPPSPVGSGHDPPI